MVIPVYDDNDLEPGFRSWIVWLLFATNIAVYLYMSLLPAEIVQLLAYWFGVVPSFIVQGSNEGGMSLPIRPELTMLTYTFIHGNWVHLAANMLFLWVLGDNVEMAMGHLRFALFYVLCGVGGGMAHVAVDPASDVPLVGASAAVAGIVGGYLLLRPSARVTFLVVGIMPVTLRAYWLFALWLAWQIANVLVPMTADSVAYWSHIGGFVTGLALTVVLRRTGVILPWFGR
ncbi:MAG: rhomboid family intramembrane serine protease [Rhizobiaceae bacterium]